MDTASNILLHVDEASSARRPPMNQDEFDNKHGFIVRSERRQWHQAPLHEVFSQVRSSDFSRKSTEAGGETAHQQLQFEGVPKMGTLQRSHPSPSTTIWDHRVFQLLPIIGSIRSYDWRRQWASDLLLGASVGMQYAIDAIAMTLVAGLPPLVGLYSSICASLIYFVLGTSTRSFLGELAFPIPICSGSIIEAHSIPYDTRYGLIGANFHDGHSEEEVSAGEDAQAAEWELAEIASTITFVSALTYALIHVSRADFLFNYLPTHIVDGITFGVAIRVIISQLARHAFKSANREEATERGSWLECLGSFSRCIGDADYYSIALVSLSIALLLGLHQLSAAISRPLRRWYTAPADFKFLLFASLASYLFEPAEWLGVAVFGRVNNTPLAPTLPRFDLVLPIHWDSFAIALLVFAIHRQLARSAGDEGQPTSIAEYPVIPMRQEMLTFTLISTLSTFLGCIPASDSESRINVAGKMAKDYSRLAHVPTMMIIAAALLLLPALLQPLPVSVLSAVVIVEALRCGYSRAVKAAKQLWHCGVSVDVSSFAITSAVAAFCDSPGDIVLASIVTGVISIALRSQWAPCEVLTSAGVGLSVQYVEKSEYNCDDAMDEPGLAVVKYRAHVLFHNAQHFKSALLEACDNISGQLMKVGIGTRTSSVKSASASLMIEMLQQQQPRTILSLDTTLANEEQISRALVLDCSPIAVMDTTGMDALMEVFDELESTRKARLLLACVNASMRKEFELAGGFDRIPKRYFFPSVHDAVLAAQQLGAGACGTVFIHNSVSLNGCREIITLSAAHSQHSHINDTTSHGVGASTTDTVSVQSISHPSTSANPPTISITTPQAHYAIARASLPSLAQREKQRGSKRSLVLGTRNSDS